MLKKLIIVVSLGIGVLGGAAGAYGFTQMDSPPVGNTNGAVMQKYPTKGSGFHQVHQPHQYHNYWTGGKKYRQNEE